MDFPEDRRYTKEHEWVLLADGIATVGITEFAQQELGDVVFVELPESGKSIQSGDAFCVVESTKAASDVYAPIGGTVSEKNGDLESSPELVNTDPYGQGWIAKFSEPNESDLEKLMDANQYKEFVGE